MFAYTATDKKLGLTVLRSPIYGDLRCRDIDLDTDYEIMEQGITEGTVRVCFDKNKCATAFSAELNNPPVVLCEANHKGDFKECASFFSVDAQSVYITALKRAENNRDHTVIRGTEYGSKAQKIKISFMNVVHEAEIAPYEIFTLLIDGEGMKKVNVLEENELKP